MNCYQHYAAGQKIRIFYSASCFLQYWNATTMSYSIKLILGQVALFHDRRNTHVSASTTKLKAICAGKVTGVTRRRWPNFRHVLQHICTRANCRVCFYSTCWKPIALLWELHPKIFHGVYASITVLLRIL